jgi:hypothetical protein
MKSNRLFLLTVTLFSCVSLLNAQSTLDEQAGNPKTEKAPKDKSPLKKNIVKVNLMALGLKNYSFQYERVLTKHISLGLGVRTMPSTGLPFQDLIVNQVADGDPDLEASLRSFKAGNFAITPELRFYLSKKGYGRGFYIAPYYRYAKFTSEEFPINFDEDGGGTSTVRLKGDITTHSGGLMFGAQWALGKVVTLDWWILGGHYGKSNGILSAIPSPPLSNDEQQNIRETIADLELPLTTITSEVSANNVRILVNGPWAGVRAGLSIGIRF